MYLEKKEPHMSLRLKQEDWTSVYSPLLFYVI